MTLVVNLYGAPSAGKSTMMAAVFAQLKMNGVNAEMSPEYVKRKVWEKSYGVLDDQLYIFGKQYHGLQMLQEQVSVAITDSPLMLSMLYGENALSGETLSAFKRLVFNAYDEMDNLNIFLDRKKEYNPIGRMQTETEADEVGRRTRILLNMYSIDYSVIPSDESGAKMIVRMIEGRIS